MMPAMPGILVAINISAGGVPKLPVPEAKITATGVAGDRQRNLKWHGGPERAVSLLAMAVIRELQAAGHPLTPGSTGENLTVDGFSAEDLAPGVHLHIGADPATAVILELTKWLDPCSKISSSFAEQKIAVFDHEKNPCRSRVGARVVRPGLVRADDPIIRIAAAP